MIDKIRLFPMVDASGYPDKTDAATRRIEKHQEEYRAELKMKKLDINVVRDFIQEQTPETKIYIGGDSHRFRKQGKFYAEYTLAIVVHFDGKHGCKIFGETSISQTMINAMIDPTCD